MLLKEVEALHENMKGKFSKHLKNQLQFFKLIDRYANIYIYFGLKFFQSMDPRTRVGPMKLRVQSFIYKIFCRTRCMFLLVLCPIQEFFTHVVEMSPILIAVTQLWPRCMVLKTIAFGVLNSNNAYHDMRPLVLRSYPKNRWLTRLMLGTWQRTTTYIKHL